MRRQQLGDFIIGVFFVILAGVALLAIGVVVLMGAFKG